MAIVYLAKCQSVAVAAWSLPAAGVFHKRKLLLMCWGNGHQKLAL